MKEVKLSYSNKPSEIYDSGLQFAFVSKDMRQCHTWVLCKDFLQDVVFGVVNRCKIRIYGFDYDPKRMPLPDMDNMRVIIRDKNMAKSISNLDERIKNLQEFLNKIENKLEFKKSIITEVKGVVRGSRCKDRMFLVLGDKKWMHAPPLISLFTLYVRIGLFHKKGASFDDTIRNIKRGEQRSFFVFKYNTSLEGMQGNDRNYLNDSRRFRLAIMKHGVDMFLPKMEDNYNINKLGYDGSVRENIDNIHNNLGIVNGTDIGCWKLNRR